MAGCILATSASCHTCCRMRPRAKTFGASPGCLARHRSSDERVSEPVVHARNLGSTEPSEAAGAEQWRWNPPTGFFRSLALVIPDKGLSKKGDVADWSIAKQYMDLVSREVRSCHRAREPCRGQSLSHEQRDRRADRGRSAITRNQHFSTKCDGEKTVTTQGTMQQRILRKARIRTSR
jgi:hypothetical protein